MDVLYFDAEPMTSGDGPFGYIFSGNRVCPAGTTLYRSPARDRLRPEATVLLQALQQADIRLIFDDEPIEKPAFYAVPQVDLFARDSRGGWYASVGGSTDPDSDSDLPICHIAADRAVTLVAPNLSNFFQRISAHPSEPLLCKPISVLTFYPSREPTSRHVTFEDLSGI